MEIIRHNPRHLHIHHIHLHHIHYHHIHYPDQRSDLYHSLKRSLKQPRLRLAQRVLMPI